MVPFRSQKGRTLKIALLLLALLAIVSASPAGAASPEKRLALVVGNDSYHAKALTTPVNDAALIAQVLRTAGFEVMGASDLDADSLRQAFDDFVDAVTKAGPETVAAVYFAGYALQLEGENYLVPIGADINSASDVPLRALRLSDETHALGALHLKATFVILDAARASPFTLSGPPLAGGLAWVEPETNMLIAFNAAPGTVAPDREDSFGPYAKALAEMIREGDLTPTNVFDRVRLRVNASTKGAQVPWDASRIETPFVFFERGSAAPARTDSPDRTAWMRSQPMGSLSANDAYMVALLRDTFDGYAEFLANFWQDPMAKRVQALLAARREAITWRRTYQANAPEAYWSYLKRYPRGPHKADAARLLARLGAAIEPPAKFATMEYDVPTPLPAETEYNARQVLVFDDPAFAFQAPPLLPAYFLEPPPSELLALQVPVASYGSASLPGLANIPLPAYVSTPAGVVVASTRSLVFNDSRKTLVVNSTGSVAPEPNRPTAAPWPILRPGTGAGMPLSQTLSGMPPPVLPDVESPASSSSATLASTPVKKPSWVAGLENLGPEGSGFVGLKDSEILAPPSAIGGRQLRGSLPAGPSLPDHPTSSKVQKQISDALGSPAAGGGPVRTPAIPSAQAADSDASPSPPVSSKPAPSTGDRLVATALVAALVPMSDNKPPIPGPEMLAPPDSGSIPTLIPAPSRLGAGSIPLPIPRSVALASPVMGSIPLPPPRPATLLPRTIAIQPLPSSAEPHINQPGQPSALSKPTPNPAIARTPQTAPAVPMQLCPVVNGRRICN